MAKHTFPDGAALRAMRLNAGLTVEQLAQAVDYNPVFLRIAEDKHGLLSGPAPKRIRRYLESLRAHERLSFIELGGPIRGKVKPIKREIDGDFPCGARTKAGTPCMMKAVYSSGRCHLHGGLSTGPNTEAGRERIREGQRRRRERERITQISGSAAL